MRCLCSIFDVKKQGKPIWEGRMRYWKLREGENRLSGLLEGISIASLGKARRQGGSNITFVQVRFLWLWGIGTPLKINLVSILWNAYRYPSSLMELEYRYWLLSTDTG
ncbi:hypothetical protein GQ457_05G016500 [Hibiscus cannabinus]